MGEFTRFGLVLSREGAAESLCYDLRLTPRGQLPTAAWTSKDPGCKGQGSWLNFCSNELWELELPALGLATE